MQKLKIEKNIPLPKLPEKSTNLYKEAMTLSEKMEMGDSILIPDRKLATVESWIRWWLNPMSDVDVHKDSDFVATNEGDKVRVWRIK